jgi:hypothetical protein
MTNDNQKLRCLAQVHRYEHALLFCAQPAFDDATAFCIAVWLRAPLSQRCKKAGFVLRQSAMHGAAKVHDPNRLRKTPLTKK